MGLVALLALGLVSGWAAPVAAQDGGEDVVDVVEVSGYLDPVLVDFIEEAIDDAEAAGAVALVLQLDSPGVLVGDDRLADLLQRVGDSSVPVAVWIGPSGADASGATARLVEAAAFRAMAPGSRLDLGDQHIGADAAFDRKLVDFPADCQRERGSEEGCAATVGDFIVSLPGVESQEVTRGDQTRLEPLSTARFAQLPLVSQLLHTVASPAVAYLLFVIGLVLIIFEAYTAGIGVAGVVGAGAFVLACYGLAILPTQPVGVVLLLLAMFGFAIDIQTGVPRVWTGIATVAFAIGSLTIYDGITLSWITLLVAVVGIVLTMLSAMPAMVRSRFSTPTIGREWMVGETGQAAVAINPDGVVSVRDAPWRARTNRATPIAAGDPVRVVGIDGLVLEVEPLVGAAVDHRERRRSLAGPPDQD